MSDPTPPEESTLLEEAKEPPSGEPTLDQFETRWLQGLLTFHGLRGDLTLSGVLEQLDTLPGVERLARTCLRTAPSLSPEFIQCLAQYWARFYQSDDPPYYRGLNGSTEWYYPPVLYLLNRGVDLALRFPGSRRATLFQILETLILPETVNHQYHVIVAGSLLNYALVKVLPSPVIRLLLDRGADLTLPGERAGSSALTYALENYNPDNLELVLRALPLNLQTETRLEELAGEYGVAEGKVSVFGGQTLRQIPASPVWDRLGKSRPEVQVYRRDLYVYYLRGYLSEILPGTGSDSEGLFGYIAESLC